MKEMNDRKNMGSVTAAAVPSSIDALATEVRAPRSLRREGTGLVGSVECISVAGELFECREGPMPCSVKVRCSHVFKFRAPCFPHRAFACYGRYDLSSK
jgi:hypothetical protein